MMRKRINMARLNYNKLDRCVIIVFLAMIVSAITPNEIWKAVSHIIIVCYSIFMVMEFIEYVLNLREEGKHGKK